MRAVIIENRISALCPGQHQTLRAALEWSYSLLSEVERMVLRRLAVFVGHFTLDAALAVVTSADLDQTAGTEVLGQGQVDRTHLRDEPGVEG